MKWTPLLLLVMTFGCVGPFSFLSTRTKLLPPTVYYNATVITQNETQPTAAGLRIHGDVITDVYIGDVPEDATGARIDLQGATLLPGLVGAHVHLRGIGQRARQLNLTHAQSIHEIQQELSQITHTLNTGRWIRGHGWDPKHWSPKTRPTAKSLDPVSPHHPVWLKRADGHAVWLNSVAMEQLGIDASAQAPKGGEIVRDRHGDPTGVFIDSAIDLLTQRLSPSPPEELRADILRGQEICNQEGLTGVHDIGANPEERNMLRELKASGLLTLRVTSCPHATGRRHQSEPGSPSQSLSPIETIHTLAPAGACAKQSDHGGQISRGMRADLTIVATDPQSPSSNVRPGMKTLRTVVGGVEVYRAPN
jgi:hypothetical protein